MKQPLARILVLFTLAAGIGFLTIYKMHKAVVTSGEYLGFRHRIWTHQRHLRWRPNLVGGGILYLNSCDRVIVERHNVEDLADIIHQDAIVIKYSDGGQSLIFAEHGVIRDMSHSPIVANPFVGAYVGELRQFIHDGLIDGTLISAFSTIKGYSADFRGYSVSLKRDEIPDHEITWLLQYDYWRLKGGEAWTEVRLFFDDGKLRRIEDLDFFVEWP